MHIYEDFILFEVWGEEMNTKSTTGVSVLLFSFALMIGLLFNGCGILGGTVEEERVDRFGTPESRWVWRYGLIGGEEEILCFDEWNTDFDAEACRSHHIMQDCEFIPFVSIAYFREQDTITVSEEKFALYGTGFWFNYLQVRVNGVLVRHRNPFRDANILVGEGFTSFETDEFPLLIGENKIELIAAVTSMNNRNLLHRVVYITRER